MLLELADHLFGIHIVNANRPVICDTTKSFFDQMGKLNLIDAARVRIAIGMDLSVLGQILGNIGVVPSVNRVENCIGFVQIDESSAVGCCKALVIGVQSNRRDRRKLVVICVLPSGRLSQICRQGFGLKIPNFTNPIFKASTDKLRVFGKNKGIN